MVSLADFFTSALSPALKNDGDDKQEAEDESPDDSKDSSEGADDSDGKEDSEGDGEEEEEEEEEPEDPAEAIRGICERSYRCKPLVQHFEKCNERVESKSNLIIQNEDCTEELFHMLHCVDSCAAPKIFKKWEDQYLEFPLQS